MKIRGNTQIRENTIDIGKLINPFITTETGNWSISDGNATITNIPDPTNPLDIVNKEYVDQLVSVSLSWKQPVTVFSDINTDLSNPATTIDGVALSNGDRIALFNQTLPSEDGVYVYNGSGQALTRSTDWQKGQHISNFTFWVEEGDTYDDTQWTVTNDPSSDVLGTDDVKVIKIAGKRLYQFTNGLTQNNSTISWGGALDKDTTINANQHDIYFTSVHNFSISDFQNPTDGIFYKNLDSILFGVHNVDQTKLYGLNLDTNNKYITFGISDNGNFNQIKIDELGKMIITDEIGTFGLKYNSDYSTLGKNDDLWLPDWKSVKNYVNQKTNRIYNECHIVSSTVNTITASNDSISNLTVYVNGVRQAKQTDYTVSNNIITFTENLLSADVVVLDYNV